MDAISNVELDRNIAEHIHSISPLICTYDFDPRSNLSAPELSFISAEPVRTWTAEKQIEICSVLAFILNLLAYLTCNEKRLNIFVADTRLHDDCAKGWTDASVDEALLCRRRTRELQPDTVPAAQPAQPRRSTEHHYCALTIPYSRPTTPLPRPSFSYLANFHNHHRYLPPLHRRRHHHPVTTTSQNNQPHRLFLTTSHYSCWIFRTCTSRLHSDNAHATLTSL